MKKYIYKIMIFSAVFLFSCADEDLEPIVTKDNLGFGAYPRLIDLASGEYDLFNLANTVYEYEVEFVSQAKGSDVQTYEIEVLFNGSNRTAYKTFGQSDFSESANGFKSIRLTIPLSEMLALYGMTSADLVPLDRFTFDTKLIMDDGRIFTFDNSTAAINGSAFQGHFRFSSTVTCPLPDADFSGTYELTYVTDASGGFGEPFELPADVTLDLISGSTTKRTIGDMPPYLPQFGGFATGDLFLDFLCDQVVVTENLEGGATCGSGEILFEQGTVMAFNINDDSSFDIELIEFSPDDGGCGANPKPITFRFTKQ